MRGKRSMRFRPAPKGQRHVARGWRFLPAPGKRGPPAPKPQRGGGSLLQTMSCRCLFGAENLDVLHAAKVQPFFAALLRAAGRAVVCFAAVFLAGVFFATVFFTAVFLVAVFLAGAALAAVFLAGALAAFFAGAFFAGVLRAVFFAGAGVVGAGFGVGAGVGGVPPPGGVGPAGGWTGVRVEPRPASLRRAWALGSALSQSLTSGLLSRPWASKYLSCQPSVGSRLEKAFLSPSLLSR